MSIKQAESWIKHELNKIKNNVKTSDDEAKTILEQRVSDIAETQGITREEALSVYKKISQNKKTIAS